MIPSRPQYLIPELLSEILLWTDESPLVLGGICASLRASVLSTPRLWSTLPDITVSRARDPSPTFIALCQAYLERSRSALLTLTITVKTEGNPEHLDHLVNLLVKQAHRWYNVNISWNNPARLKAIFTSNCQSLKILTLALNSRREQGRDSIGIASPELREVILGGCFGDIQVELRPSGLLRYYGGNRRLLDDATELEEFTLTHPPSDISDFQPLSHAKLKKLRVYGYMNTSAIDLWLSQLTLPSLVEICIESSQISTIGQVIFLVKRSSCSLRSLDLSLLMDDTDAAQGRSLLLGLLQQTPNLVRLVVSGQVVGAQAVTILSSQEPQVVPLLKDLVFYHYQPAQSSINDMLQSRCNHRSAPDKRRNLRSVLLGLLEFPTRQMVQNSLNGRTDADLETSLLQLVGAMLVSRFCRPITSQVVSTMSILASHYRLFEM